MFKKAGDAVAYLDRTGSHSTKGSRTGLVKVLPPEAVTEEPQYRTALEQYRALQEEKHRLHQLLARTNLAVVRAPSSDAVRVLKQERERVIRQLVAIEPTLVQLRQITKGIGNKSYCEAFYWLARSMMDLKAFDMIDAATAQTLGRIRDETGAPARRRKAKDRLGLPLDATEVLPEKKTARPTLILAKTPAPAKCALVAKRAEESDLIASAWEE